MEASGPQAGGEGWEAGSRPGARRWRFCLSGYKEEPGPLCRACPRVNVHVFACSRGCFCFWAHRLARGAPGMLPSANPVRGAGWGRLAGPRLARGRERQESGTGSPRHG